MTEAPRTDRMRKLMAAGVVLALALPWLGLPGHLFPGDALAMRIGREAIWWALGAIILFWVVRVERLPLSSIGIRRPTIGTFGWGLAFGVLMLASVIFCYALIFPAFGLSMNQKTVGNIIAVPLWLQTAMMIRAGVIEEILFRGYPIERIEALTGRVWIGAIIAGLSFIFMHLAGWGGAQLIVVSFGAVIMTGLYLWRRDLPCVMIAHALTDIVGFMLARMQS